MKRLAMLTIGIGLCLSLLGAISAQEREDRTILPRDQMRAIINEASGERAAAAENG